MRLNLKQGASKELKLCFYKKNEIPTQQLQEMMKH